MWRLTPYCRRLRICCHKVPFSEKGTMSLFCRLFAVFIICYNGNKLNIRISYVWILNVLIFYKFYLHTLHILFLNFVIVLTAVSCFLLYSNLLNFYVLIFYFSVVIYKKNLSSWWCYLSISVLCYFSSLSLLYHLWCFSLC